MRVRVIVKVCIGMHRAGGGIGFQHTTQDKTTCRKRRPRTLTGAPNESVAAAAPGPHTGCAHPGVHRTKVVSESPARLPPFRIATRRRAKAVGGRSHPTITNHKHGRPWSSPAASQARRSSARPPVLTVCFWDGARAAKGLPLGGGFSEGWASGPQGAEEGWQGPPTRAGRDGPPGAQETSAESDTTAGRRHARGETVTQETQSRRKQTALM